jgi:hypothetical protein
MAIGLYPPWRVEVATTNLRACSHGSLFSPPQTVDIDFGSGAEPRSCRAIGLDTVRLLVEWAVVALAVGGALVIQELHRQASGAPPKPPSISSKTQLR